MEPCTVSLLATPEVDVANGIVALDATVYMKTLPLPSAFFYVKVRGCLPLVLLHLAGG